MIKRLKPALAAAACLLLLCYPEAALSAAREATRAWANAFAPALFPFFAITPALTCPEAEAFFRRVADRPLRFLFGIGGESFPAVLMGLFAGSPAGSRALRACGAGEDPAERTRAALLCSGLSPAFLVTTAGVALTGSAEAGLALLRAQWGALALAGFLLRGAFRRNAPSPLPPPCRTPSGGQAVREAALAVITVGGWMLLFSAGAGVLCRALALDRLRAPMLAFMESAGGCAALAQSGMPFDGRLCALAATAGFGGASVIAQNLSALRGLDVRAGDYIFGKSLHALIAALLLAAQTPFLREGEAAVAPVFSAMGTARVSAAGACVVTLAAFAAIRARAEKNTN